jgi:hypothetical protein
VVENITSQKSKYALYLRGYPEAPIKDVHVSHCTFNNVGQPDVIQHVADIQLEDCKRNGEPMKQA